MAPGRAVRRLAAVLTIVTGAVVIGPGPAHAIAIDNYQWNDYAPLSTPCAGADTTGLTRLVAWLWEGLLWTPTRVGTLNCDRDMPSLHREGRAVDWHLDVHIPAQFAAGNLLTDTLMAKDAEGNQHSLIRRMGIQEIIWNDLAWDSRLGDGGWVDYTKSQPGNNCNWATGNDYVKFHCNHVHIGLHKAGGNEQTTFWNRSFTQRSDSTFYLSAEGTTTSAGSPFAQPIYGRPRDNALGLPGDKPVVGDFDGNRLSTIGIVRGHIWYLRDAINTGAAGRIFGYGLDSDVPIMGDWNGDGVQTPGIVRIQNGQLWWYLRNSNTDGVADIAFQYGNPGDVPVVGNWDGIGGQSVGVFRTQGTGTFWYLRNSLSTGVADLSFSYGFAGDLPVVGDWNGDGRDTQGIARLAGAASARCPLGGMQFKLSDTLGAGANRVFGYGCWGDKPFAGDWNASGTDTVAVARRF